MVTKIYILLNIQKLMNKWTIISLFYLLMSFFYDIIFLAASMAELVDAADSKSVSSDRVPVQVRMEAPLL